MSTASPQLSVSETVHHRRSIRAFTSEPVPQAEIDAILDETRLAPSAWNLQPWRFVVVREPAVRAQLAEIAFHQRQVVSAPVVVVITTDVADAIAHLDEIVRPGTGPKDVEAFRERVRATFAEKPEAEREAWGAAQGFIALAYLLLAAESRGWATSPMSGFDAEAAKRLLGLPAHVRVPAIVPIGRADETGLPHHRLPLARLVRTI